ncbi:MAG: arylsulfatase [Bacteroidota bacterium]
MNTRQLIFAIIIFLCLQACDTSTDNQQASSPTPPNVVLILADDLGYGELGAYGQQIIETPHLDALAASGKKFTQFYSGSAVCAPARGVLLTGQHTGHAHVRGNDEWKERGDVWNFEAMFDDPTLEGQRPLPDSIITLAEQLQDNGYKTACIGKWGLGAPDSEGTPNRQGFDFFYGYNCQRQAHTYYPTHLWKNEERVLLDNTLVPPHKAVPEDFFADETASYAPYNQADYAATLMQKEVLQFVEDHKTQPFFLYYSTPIPHVALQAPQKWVDHYRTKFGAEQPYTGKSYVPCQYPKATYAAMISYLDEQVGELVDKLKQAGVYDNTIILFTSDNGPTFLDQVDIAFFESAEPLRNESSSVKASLREGGIRVPLIATWPNHIEAGSTSEHLAAFWDFLPTICELTATDIPKGQMIDGISFAPTLLDAGQQTQHEYLYWEFPERGGSQAIRQGKWKAYRDNIKTKGNLNTELYNLETDLKEQINLAKQFPTVVADLEAKMAASRYPSRTERWKMGVLDSSGE